MSNNLNAAKRNKNDEFYTQLTDIENELRHYKDHFEGKVVYLNCDDPQESNFWMYFYLNFEFLGLRKLISTHYDDIGPTYKLEYLGRDVNPEGAVRTELEENGDFRSNEAIELLRESDIVVTNPPFSLFREYIAQIMDHEKQFLVVGNFNAITYKEIFPLIKDVRVWVGVSPRSMKFRVPDGSLKVVNATWFTNLDHTKRHEEQILYCTYTPEKYPRYDDHDAINVDRVKDIPEDYDGIMGVPITFLADFNPDQFEILGCHEPCIRLSALEQMANFKPYVSRQITRDGVVCQKTYHRLFIRKR